MIMKYCINRKESHCFMCGRKIKIGEKICYYMPTKHSTTGGDTIYLGGKECQQCTGHSDEWWQK